MSSNEKIFNALMQTVRREEKDGTPLDSNHPVETFLSQMEYQAGMDARVYRETQPGYFQLVAMTDDEFASFRRLVESGSIRP